MELRSGPFSFLDLPSDDDNNRFVGISWLLLHLFILRHNLERKTWRGFRGTRSGGIFLWRRRPLSLRTSHFPSFPLFSCFASLQIDPLY
ncbi:hypothetical protein Nepgr_018322 [Nepenthes gracilis]|uniref:Uncharacterized protein n=1 Tax=Nepenthes gracilis TaxID=150966 RepID=A0AAD3STG6_NEPGR|nr:hypothetical protein Nepgr_018322 [Nepenthes gracilis]